MGKARDLSLFGARRTLELGAIALAVAFGGCNAIFDIEEGTPIGGEAGDGDAGATGGRGGKGGASTGGSLKGGSSNGGASGGLSTGGSPSGGTGGSLEGGSGGKGGADGTGGTGGKGGSDGGGASGGGTTGGTAGAAATGGGGGMGGTVAPAAGGASGAGGSVVPVSGGAAGMMQGPYACGGIEPTCSEISEFPLMGSFGIGAFTGGVSIFGAGVTRDASTTAALHVTGMVTGYGHGFVLWFTSCSDLSGHTGITFTLSGTSTTTAGVVNAVDFQLQTNSTSPWQPNPENGKGGCTAPDPLNAWATCIAPSLTVSAAGASQTILWSAMVGGAPTAWNPAVSPSELLGIQWQFPWSATATAYAVNVTLDDVKFAGPLTFTDCATP